MLPVHHHAFTSGWPADRLIMQSSLSGGRFCLDSGTFDCTEHSWEWKGAAPALPQGANVADGESLMGQMSAVQLRAQNSPPWALVSLGVRACPKFGEKAKSAPSGQLRQSQLLPFSKFSSSVC